MTEEEEFGIYAAKLRALQERLNPTPKKKKVWTIKEIIAHIRKSPSYFKKSKKFLKHKFNCGDVTITRALNQLEEDKKRYYDGENK